MLEVGQLGSSVAESAVIATTTTIVIITVVAGAITITKPT
jgi:hypothetical protein